jgi:hypothetical protein
MLTLNIVQRRHILGFEAEGRRSLGKAGMGGRIHHRQEIFLYASCLGMLASD